MSNPYMGEVRMFGGNFAPRGWALCNGALLGISQYSALFSLLGTTYGGDGVTNFALPDLRGRLPIHQGTGIGLSARTMGEIGGAETVTLSTTQMPQHNHPLNASTSPGSLAGPANAVPATPTGGATPFLYAVPGTSQLNPVALAPNIQPTGGSQPHSNMMPSLCVTIIISLEGVFPSRN
jgi:microcystin-dependent protein